MSVTEPLRQLRLDRGPLLNGPRTPGAHDGIAAFRTGHRVNLMRNHEQGIASPFSRCGATARRASPRPSLAATH